MAQRTKWGAWGLVVILVAVVLGGGNALIGCYLRSRHIRVVYQPIGQWSFGSKPVSIGCCASRPPLIVGESISLGPVEVSWPNRVGRMYPGVWGGE